MEPLLGHGPSAGAGELPRAGWQAEALPVLRALAADEPSVQKLEVAGSAAGDGRVLDVWSDLDVLVTIDGDSAPVAERLAQAVPAALGPLYASSRSGDGREAGVRLVLADLRRIDLTVRTADAALHPPAQCGAGGLAGIAAAFRFDAVLAAFKAARQDLLISAHLALQLPRHVLVAAMILRDQETGTRHHRYGSTEWNVWPERLGAVAPPSSTLTITASIRHHAHVLQDLLAVHAPDLAVDDDPLHRLLAAVDRSAERQSAPSARP
ncbi:hypothetical protein ACIRD3_35780 [Kitasatospora sp. NPDC093550]|uniref:hypothetical protein n=1 Tax=Kitasatospora sp. NPDC093550 TaxID=3364089 RepID=UPI00380425CA